MKTVKLAKKFRWLTVISILLLSLPAKADQVVDATSEDLSAFDQMLEKSQNRAGNQEQQRKATEAGSLAIGEARRVREERRNQNEASRIQERERERQHFGPEGLGRQDSGSLREQMPKPGQNVRGGSDGSSGSGSTAGGSGGAGESPGGGNKN